MNTSLMALMGLAVLVSLGLCVLGGMTKVNITSRAWVVVARQVASVWLTLFLVFLGWRLWKFEHQAPAAAAPPPAAVAAPAASSAAIAPPAAEQLPGPAPAAEQPADRSNRWLRWLLWLNLALALPWITAFVTRYILALRSNAASFALLASYTLADLALGMIICGFSYAGWGGVFRLVGLVALCLGYNYWACELVASLWIVGRRRMS